MAFIELHGLDDINYYIDEITRLYSIYYLLKSNKEEAKVKILIVLSSCEIESSHCISIKRLCSLLDMIFYNSDGTGKGIGLVITKADIDSQPMDYIDQMSDNPSKQILNWCYFFQQHPEQVFLMPRASRSMEGKLYDFEDKYRILDFIKNDQSFNPKLLLYNLVPMLTLLKMDIE